MLADFQFSLDTNMQQASALPKGQYLEWEKEPGCSLELVWQGVAGFSSGCLGGDGL